jgi:hypothetical protein
MSITLTGAPLAVNVLPCSPDCRIHLRMTMATSSGTHGAAPSARQSSSNTSVKKRPALTGG